MAFIKYNKKIEDRYDEVLQYAKAQQEEDQRRKDDARVGKWMAERIGQNYYTELPINDLVKALIMQYRKLKQQDEASTTSIIWNERVNRQQLWCDFWILTIEKYVQLYELEPEKRDQYLLTFITKVFKCGGEQMVEAHLREKLGNSRYGKYLTNCFQYQQHEMTEFWKWKLAELENRKAVADYIRNYFETICLMGYYLYSTIRPQDSKWQQEVEAEEKYLRILLDKYEHRQKCLPNVKRLVNPLYTDFSIDRYVPNRCRVLVLNHKIRVEEEERMIGELYAAFADNKIEAKSISSLIPVHVKTLIKDGVLPELEKTDNILLDAEEKVHYFNHTILFYPVEKDDEITFSEYKGIIYFTSKRIIFSGSSQLSISYDAINKTVLYDAIPEVLGVMGETRSCFFQMPDCTEAYMVLKLIVNKEKQETQKRLAISYEEALTISDIDSMMFSLEYMLEQKFPVSIKGALQELFKNIQQISLYADGSADKKRDVEGFMRQYMPGIVKLLSSYLQYQVGGQDYLLLDQVSSKVEDSILAFRESIHKKIYNVYQEQAFGILAQAEELMKSIGGETVEMEKLPFSLEELSQNGDVGADIIAFEYVMGYNLPKELKTAVESVVQKLYGLRKTLEYYPDRAKEVENFLCYYVPEALRIIISYHRYQGTGLDQATMDKVYKRVMDSVEMVDSAIEIKIKDIYRMATMNTVAQADALQTILGQDGYTMGNQILKH